MSAIDVQARPKLHEDRRWKPFGEDVSVLRSGGNMQYFDVTKDHDMFGPLMLHRVAGHVDGTDVVTVHNCDAAKRGVQL